MEGPFVRVTLASSSAGDDAPIAFLDRDGVINVGRQGYVNRPEEVELLEGVAPSIAQLRQHGYRICVVTNQSPIARGLWGAKELEAIHREVQRQLLETDEAALVDVFITCPHRFEEGCGCRKPSPAMLSLGHRVLRTSLENPGVDSQYNAGRQEYDVNWWGTAPQAPHPLDAMVGDRRSDMGAGWAYGARLFRVSGRVGLTQVVDRLCDPSDRGDGFHP
jgi:histidinol-phosphate phosphatase family protein